MSNYVRLANFFELYSIDKNAIETIQYRYTNGSAPGKSLSFTGSGSTAVPFTYLSFIYQGAAKNRTGDNLQAGLTLSTNPISTGLAQQALTNKWHLRIWTTTLDPLRNYEQVQKVLTFEDWLVASLSYDPDAVEVVLSSGIDAVTASAPNKVLTRSMVGALPTTGSITAR